MTEKRSKTGSVGKRKHKGRAVMFSSLCAAAAAAVCITATTMSVPAVVDEGAVTSRALEKSAADSAVTIPDIEEYAGVERSLPISSAALSPDSGEHVTADF
ncbi:MAG: hypothetical protein LBS67_01295 [Clostridiales Family XIII bacterium]|jgi:hypothetical protein|nr:hypothetical protein [Clostridiales Family XIII bacterium]